MNDELSQASGHSTADGGEKKSLGILPIVGLVVVVVVGAVVWFAMKSAANKAEIAAKDRLLKAFPKTAESNGILLRERDEHVQSVDLRRQSVTAETIADISKLGHLTHIDLTESGLTDDALNGLGRLPKLIGLTMAGNDIGDAGMAATTRHPKLQTLYIRNTNITDEGLKTIGKIKSIINLDLSGTKITDDGLKHLARMDKLQRLTIQATGITDAGLLNLEPMKSLAHIDAGATSITDDGVAALAARFRENSPEDRPGLTHDFAPPVRPPTEGGDESGAGGANAEQESDTADEEA